MTKEYKIFFSHEFPHKELLKDKREYIEVACKFATSLQETISRTVASKILEDFVNWVKYVEYQSTIDNHIDVNNIYKIDYRQFKEMIYKVQRLYAYPNEIFRKDGIFLR